MIKQEVSNVGTQVGNAPEGCRGKAPGHAVSEVLIAHPHALVRRGLSEILRETFRNVAVAWAETGPETVGKCRKRRYDMVILDARIPGMGGLDVLAQICRQGTGQNVLVFNPSEGDEEEGHSLRIMRAGALGYLGRTACEKEIAEGLRKVFAGKRYLTGEVAERLAECVAEGGKWGSVDSLSDREYQVYRMLRDGRSVKSIADDLCLAAKTIYTHRERIRSKLHVKTDRALAGLLENTLPAQSI